MRKKLRVGGGGRRQCPQDCFGPAVLGALSKTMHVLVNPGIMIATSRGIHVGIDANLT